MSGFASFIYDSAIAFYGMAIRIVAFWNPKARRWVRGRKNFWRNFPRIKPGSVWFHCASLGEFEQGRPLIEVIRKEFPGQPVVISFFSPSGFDVRKNYEGADLVLYLPLDSKKNAERFLNFLRPSVAVFIKYEFWMNFLAALQRRKIPVFVVSAIFRKRNFFTRFYGRPFRQMLRDITKIFVQDENSKRVLSKLRVDEVVVSGDTRFDRVMQLSKNPSAFPDLVMFASERFTVVAGSTWPVDEKLIFRAMKDERFRELRWILVPHEVGEKHLIWIEKNIPVKTFRYSQLQNAIPDDVQCLLIDRIGMLSILYSIGKLAYVGGGFGKGIHNLLEPAAHGIPVMFGPKHEKFREAGGLISSGGGFAIRSGDEFISNLLSWVVSDEKHDAENLRLSQGQRAADYVRRNTGAVESVMNEIRHHLN